MHNPIYPHISKRKAYVAWSPKTNTTEQMSRKTARFGIPLLLLLEGVLFVQSEKFIGIACYLSNATCGFGAFDPTTAAWTPTNNFIDQYVQHYDAAAYDPSTNSFASILYYENPSGVGQTGSLLYSMEQLDSQRPTSHFQIKMSNLLVSKLHLDCCMP